MDYIQVMKGCYCNLTSKNDLNFELSMNQLIKNCKIDSVDLNTSSSEKHLSFDTFTSLN